MKIFWICLTAIIIAVIGYMIYDHYEKQVIKKEKSSAQLRKISSDMDKISRHTKWLEKNLQFEVEMRRILRKTGYSLEQANDSLIAAQDEIYFKDSLSHIEQTEWYKEHRKDLLNFPSDYYKQFPKEKH